MDMTNEIESSRESEGVLFNINPRLVIFTTEKIGRSIAADPINKVEGVEMHSFDAVGKGVKMTLENNRMTLEQVLEIRDNYLDISDYDIFDTKLTTVNAEENIQGLFTGFEPLVRGSRVDADVALEVTSTEATKRGIETETGPSATVKRANNKHIITGAFPTGVSVEDPDTTAFPRRIAKKLDIPFEDISFAARAVTTELSDIIG